MNLVKTGTPNPRIMQMALGAATAAGLAGIVSIANGAMAGVSIRRILT